MKLRVVFLSTLVVLCSLSLFAQDWAQWSHDAQHRSAVSTVGQSLNQNIVNLVYDPLVPQEMAESVPIYGEAVLLAHYQDPLVDGNDVYMMYKAGQYNVHNYSSQQWVETKYTWNGAH